MWLTDAANSSLYGGGYVWKDGQGADKSESEGNWRRHGPWEEGIVSLALIGEARRENACDFSVLLPASKCYGSV